jgi:hypoxanthine phosphoribosyltransferase
MNVISKTDYFNTISSLSLITIEKNYVLKLFSLISSLNHIIPLQYRNNNIVKPLFSQVILQNELPQLFVNLISVLDCFPILNSKLNIVEMIGGVTRQFIMLKNSIKLFNENNYILFLFYIFSTIIYYFERKQRIKSNNRHNFGYLHIVEHIQLYLYAFKNFEHNAQKSKQNIIIFILFFGLLFPSFIFKFINIYLIKNYNKRLPSWFDLSLKKIYDTKIYNNYNSFNLFNYFIKFYSHKLNFDVMNWKTIETKLDTLSYKINNDNFTPDICVGVASGGAFCLKYLSQKLKCEKNFYLKCKTWSGNNIIENINHTINFYINYECYLNNKKFNIKELNELFQYMKTNKVKNVLLFDDTISTGKTIFQVNNYLKNNYPEINLKIATFIIPDKKIGYLANYYVDEGTVPIIWEWGVELD